MFTTTYHPILLTIITVTQRLIICLTANLIIKNSWISYVLFLIFLGGIIILFIYICRLASNELFTKKIKTNNIIFIITGYLIISIIVKKKLNQNNLDYKILFIKIFNKIILRVTIILILYLLLVLVITVKNTSLHLGPLRTKKNI